MKSLRGGPFFAFSLPGGAVRTPDPVSYVTPLPTVEKYRLPKTRVKAKSSLSGRIDFITMHHQAGVNIENFTEVNFRDILLTGTGHRDRRLNRDSPGQKYGRSNLNQNLKPKSNFRFIREKPFAIPSFHQKCRPGALLPPLPLVGSLVGTAIPHLFLVWERVPTSFCTRNVTWRFRFFISISTRSAWSSTNE